MFSDHSSLGLLSQNSRDWVLEFPGLGYTFLELLFLSLKLSFIYPGFDLFKVL